MAAREDTIHTHRVRARIQTTQLIKRLEDNALAGKEFMTTGQIQSANIVLKKAVPDLRALDKEPDDTGQLQPLAWDK